MQTQIHVIHCNDILQCYKINYVEDSQYKRHRKSIGTSSYVL